LKVTSRSSGVIQGQLRSNGVNIGVWTWNLVCGVNCWCQGCNFDRSKGVLSTKRLKPV